MQLTPRARVLLVLVLAVLALLSLYLSSPLNVVTGVAAIVLAVLFVAGFGIPRR